MGRNTNKALVLQFVNTKKESRDLAKKALKLLMDYSVKNNLAFFTKINSDMPFVFDATMYLLGTIKEQNTAAHYARERYNSVFCRLVVPSKVVLEDSVLKDQRGRREEFSHPGKPMFFNELLAAKDGKGKYAI